MNSYRFALVISVTVNMIASSRELLLFSTLPNSRRVFLPLPYAALGPNCHSYQQPPCHDGTTQNQQYGHQGAYRPNPTLYHLSYERMPLREETILVNRPKIFRSYKNKEFTRQKNNNEVKQPPRLKKWKSMSKNITMVSKSLQDINKLVMNNKLAGEKAIDKLSINEIVVKNVSSEISERLLPVSNTYDDQKVNYDDFYNKYLENRNIANIHQKIDVRYSLPNNIFHENNNDKRKLYSDFKRNVDELERKFYQVSFEKLSANSPPGRQENGISFAQSGLFLHLVLMSLSITADQETKTEIENCLNFRVTDSDRKYIIQQVLSTMPVTGDELKFRWSTRLILGHDVTFNNDFNSIKNPMNLQVDNLNGTESPATLTKFLNHLVELDSGGAMHNTFDEDELSSGVSAVMISMLYIRGRWRSAPTLLNGTRPFRDAAGAPADRTFGAIRINDVIRYAEFNEWDAEAIEIPYASPGLSLLLLVPRDTSLRRLARRLSSSSVDSIVRRMHSLRGAVTVPIYTLRMTLLLPSKLEALGITKILDTSTNDTLKLSHAIQRIMFWSEAGRNAFKDDGIEWDDLPELELVVDRPYIFFLRWNDMTLLTGNFVL